MNKTMISIPIIIYDKKESELYEDLGIKRNKEELIALLHFRASELTGYYADPEEFEKREIVFYTSFNQNYVTPYNEKTIKLFNDILNEKTI